MRTSIPRFLVVAAILAGGCTSNDGTAGAGGATGGAAGSSGTVFPGSDAGAFVPSGAKSCAEPTGGGLLCGGESCCTSLVVPGGTFAQGRSLSAADQCPAGMTCSSSEVPEFSSTVSAFALDKHEVTVGRFRKFVNAYQDNATTVPGPGAGAHPNIPNSGWSIDAIAAADWNAKLPATRGEMVASLKCDPTFQTWTDTPGANETLPINCVSWFEAFAFCVWDGGRLPTESEWENAAAGGSDNRLYPWGTASPNCGFANFFTGDAYCGPGGAKAPANVGSYQAGNGKWGHADLAGNVNEWVLDSLQNASGTNAYPTVASTDYANVYGRDSGPPQRIIVRGGDFIYGPYYLRAAFRGSFYSIAHFSHLGARCARAVQ